MAARYHAAMGAFEKSEKRYQAALDALDAAISERRATDVPSLRKAVGRAELELKTALVAASAAHVAYWRGRRLELEPQLRQAGALMHRYDRLARAEGIRSVNPALAHIQSFFADAGPQPDIIDNDAVPIEPPDSELLGDSMGAWRWGA